MRSAFPTAVLLALFCCATAAAQTVGSVGAFNTSATGTPPGSSSRVLALGADVVQQERLQTDAQGTAQITFLDKSALNVGRNSTIVIDKFVYDPGGGAGEMTTSLTRGALRFVGGQVSHTAGARIETPTASIGARGAIATVVLEGNGLLRVIDGYGVVTVTNAAGSEVLRRPGWEITVAGPGAIPSPPHPVDPATLAAIEARFLSGRGQHGGARTPPTDLGYARSGVGSTRAAAQPPDGSLTGAANGLAQEYSTTQGLSTSGVLNAPRCTPRTIVVSVGVNITTCN